MLTAKPTSKYTQQFHDSTGTGSLEAARGQDHLTRDGVVLTGEQDIFGKPFDAAAMAKLEASGNSWSGGNWNGSTWSGSSWSGNTLERQHVVRQQLVGLELELEHLVRQHAGAGNSWSGKQLVRQQLVGLDAGAATPGRATRGWGLAGARRVSMRRTRPSRSR